MLIISLLVACQSKSNTSSSSENTSNSKGEGGVIKVASSAQPATMDPHMNTAVILAEVSRNVFEQLFTLNSKYQAVPMLAESYDLSDDGKTYTFHLRKGVKFHNGKEMKAEDVVASLKKWSTINSKAAMFKDGEFKVQDDYTVVLTLPKRTFGIIEAIADNGQFSGIMPKELAESAGPEGVKEYIGTGPFKFVEWKQDQYIHLTKYKDYSPVNTKPDGLSGKKEVFVKDLYYYITPDDSTRVAGLQTGEYDVSASLPIDNYDQLKSVPSLKFKKSNNNLWAIFNKKQGIFTDINMRHAVDAAIDNESMLVGVKSKKDFYRLDSSYMYKEQPDWHSDGGKENYNVNDVKKAKEYLQKAGYNGQEIRILTTRDYDFLYNAAVITKEQLEKAGMKVRLDVYDWATLVQKRTKPEEWDIFYTGFPLTILSPTQLLPLSATWPGWTSDPKLTEYIQAIEASTSAEEAQKIWTEEAQTYVWEYLPAIKIGDVFDYTAYSDKLEDFEYFEGMVFWNTKKK